MKRIFYTLLTAFCWLLLPPMHANDLQKQSKDSLLRIYLASPADSTRLEVLYKLALFDQLTPTFIYYENKLLEEAIAQKNIRYQSAATYGHIVYYYNRLDQKRTEQWLHKLELLAEHNNYYEHYFKGKKMLIEFYIISQKIELALKESQDMYDKAEKLNNKNGMREACLCLLTGYFNTLRYKEGLAALNKAFELTGPNISAMDHVDLLTKAVLTYSYLHDNENLYRYLNQLEKAKEKLRKETNLTNGYLNLYMLLDLQYALYYTRCQQPEKAWEYLQKAEEYLSPSTFLPYRLTRLAAYAEYYQLTEDYDKALAYLDEAIQLIAPISPEDVQIYGLQKANLLVKMGRPDEALPLYKQITKTKDSLYTAFSASQIEQIQSIYNMDNLILLKERRQKTFHRICLAISVVIILALVYFNIRIYSNRKKLEQDEKEMRKLAAIAEEANEVKSRFLANMSYNIRIPLNNVVGFSQLLSTDTDLSEDERNDYSGIIQANSTELIQLVNDVLDLSRLEAKMMKFQLQDCNVEEWSNDLACMTQMHSDGNIQLILDAKVSEAIIHTDLSRLNQIVLSTLLYPGDCTEPREVKMTLQYQSDMNIITGEIENSPLADPRFASQKVSVRQKINQLFFEHFGGSYRLIETKEEGVPNIIFTYPTLS